ncbi:ZnF C2H2 [Geosmithia morbida]|uniref:ZnF C2H2 n=1 Tax=Geosmithia morbida TaxID=1094350 RepID=A0A9P4Z058_9HYPO|nr:ZnF C2H2 [Geosmithia morbida]KAF4125727.1 ZnF C2H2 [Geosmithia morbida]
MNSLNTDLFMSTTGASSTQPDRATFQQAWMSSMFPVAVTGGNGQVHNWLLWECPWTAPQGNMFGVSSLGVTRNSPFHVNYKLAGIQSECDTVPGDSGYGSFLPSSIPDTSAYSEDVNQFLRDAENGMIDLHTTGAGSCSLSGGVSARDGHVITANTSTTPSGGGLRNYVCSDCGELCRSNSILKKHRLRHEKPFVCQEGSCARGTGFTSKNDLNRHLMTVHKNISLGITYVCHEEACRTKPPKAWPRADNFRSHLLRVHKIAVPADGDLSRYHNRSSGPMVDELSGVGTGHQELALPPARSVAFSDVMLAQDDPASPQEVDSLDLPADVGETSIQPCIPDDALLMPPPSAHRWHTSTSTTQPRDSQPSSSTSLQCQSAALKPFVSGVPEGHLQDNSGITAPARYLKEDSDSSPSEPLDAQWTSGVAEKQQSVSSSGEENDLDQDRPDSKILLSVPATSTSGAQDLHLDYSQMLECLKKIPPKLLKAALNDKKKPEKLVRRALLKCPECNKKFRLPCELKKHRKRHDRPYGCTVSQCPQNFGSKNDWKRHESSQHNPNDLWHCNCNHAGGSCGSSSSSSSGVGVGAGHCTSSFWCGFCRSLISVVVGDRSSSPPVPSPIDQRFNHIDDHFMGRGGLPVKNIKEWCSDRGQASGQSSDTGHDNGQHRQPPSSDDDTGPGTAHLEGAGKLISHPSRPLQRHHLLKPAGSDQQSQHIAMHPGPSLVKFGMAGLAKY